MPTLSVRDLLNASAIPPLSNPVHKASVYSFFNGLGIHKPARRAAIPEAPVSESFSIYKPAGANIAHASNIAKDYYDPYDLTRSADSVSVDPGYYQIVSLGMLGDIERSALSKLPTPLLKVVAEELSEPESAPFVKEALRSPDPLTAMSLLVRDTIHDALYPESSMFGMGKFKKKLKKLGKKVNKIAKNVGRTFKKGLPFIAIAATLIPVAGPLIAAALGAASAAMKARNERKAQLKAKKASKAELAAAEAEIAAKERDAMAQLDSVYGKYESEFTEMGMPRDKWNTLTLEQKSEFFDRVMREGRSAEAQQAASEARDSEAEDAEKSHVTPVQAPPKQPAPVQPVVRRTSPVSASVSPSVQVPVESPSTMIIPSDVQRPAQEPQVPAVTHEMHPKKVDEEKTGIGKILVPLGIAIAALFAIGGGGN